MADQLEWPVEEIPDHDLVFMRAHQMYFRGGELAPGVFQSQDGSMSVNWERYASAEDTRRQARTPKDNAVISLLVGGMRQIELRVQHTPVQNVSGEANNRAHSDVYLPNDREELVRVRLLLRRLAKIALPL